METVLGCPISIVNNVLEVLRVLSLLDADVFSTVFRNTLGFLIFGLIREKSLRKLSREGIVW